MAVLVVEDETEIREDVADVLRDEGYEVVTAANGAEALEHLRRGAPPCVILLDLMMPVMTGPEFRIAQLLDPTVASVPVVVVSGAGNARQKALDMKAVAHLAKPFQLHDLLATVARYC